jgi:hypothetical protein
MKRLACALSLASALWVPVGSLADTVGVGTPSGLVSDFKTPPLQTSQTINLPLGIHFSAPNPGYAGWAGAYVQIHLADPSEVDFVQLAPVAGHFGGSGLYPFGPPSGGSNSAAQFFTLWNSAAPGSGLNVNPSLVVPVGSLLLHAKNTTPINNSDFDLTAVVWNIFHLRGPAPGSTLIPLPNSAYVYANPSTNPVPNSFTGFTLPVPASPAPIGSGVWVHQNRLQSKFLHVPTGHPGSLYYALKVGTVKVGIEHVPEPATALLLGAGFALLGASRYLRRQRLQAS